jgi:aspartate-semialdehyde dehydrogenase
MKTPIPVTVLGATGAVGQRFVQLLAEHPWFEVTCVTGSERSVGNIYGDICRWILPDAMPEGVARLKVMPSETQAIPTRLVFSALPSDDAKVIEPTLAQAGMVVCSNASAFRMQPDVPILLPEVNPDHVKLVEAQHGKRGWSGAILTNPNCTSTGMTVALKAIQTQFKIKRLFAVSLQAISGAGYPGVSALDILDNVLPYISGEEEKIELEPLKMLGKLDVDCIQPAEMTISAHANRVAVSEGHTVCLSIELEQPATLEQAARALAEYQAPQIVQDLPSTPRPVIHLATEPDRPQPRRDRFTGKGMTTVVGRLRPDPLFDLKMVVLSHNTIRGAAGGSIYNAELYVSQYDL